MHAPWGNTHESAWINVRDNDFISGMFIWTGFDYLGEPTPTGGLPAVPISGSWTLQVSQRTFILYRSEWTDTPVLHLFPHWNWSEGETVDVWAYYNGADSVELFLNEKIRGFQQQNKGPASRFLESRL